MEDALDTLIGWVGGQRAETCVITHRAQGSGAPKGRSVTWDDGGGFAVLDMASVDSGVIALTVCEVMLGPRWYTELPVALARCGVRRIELDGWGWWIGPGPAPRVARIIDHIACHLPSPLTGSGRARGGEAFVSMREAYDPRREVVGGANLSDEDTVEVVLWHTAAIGVPPGEVIQVARSAGCSVASPNVAPWAIGARAAGVEFWAKVTSLTDLSAKG